MATRRYVLNQRGFKEGLGEVAAPRQVIEMLLMEKYHWTPMEIDSIPRFKLDEMMMVMNQRHQTGKEIEMRKRDLAKIKKGGLPTVGGNARSFSGNTPETTLMNSARRHLD